MVDNIENIFLYINNKKRKIYVVNHIKNTHKNIHKNLIMPYIETQSRYAKLKAKERQRQHNLEWNKYYQDKHYIKDCLAINKHSG